MRKYFLIAILFLINNITLAQSGFAKGFEVGYKEGWCYDRGVGCIPPIPPIAPIPKIGEDMNSYQDGYRRGFTMGQQDAKKSNAPTSRKRYQTSESVFMDAKDLIYNPDYKTAAMINMQKEREYKRTLAEVYEILDYLNFNYLPIEGHVVEQIKLYYQQKVEALAYKIKSNPLNCQQYENEIRELRTYAQNDKFIHKKLV